MHSLSFTAYVRAQPQGSSSAFVIRGTNRAIVTSANKKLKPYRTAIALAAKEQIGAAIPLFPADVPVRVSVDFRLKRPKTVKRGLPAVRPDLDKLVRAFCDALTGIAWHDDAQVVSIVTSKLYAEEDSVHAVISAI